MYSRYSSHVKNSDMIWLDTTQLMLHYQITLLNNRGASTWALEIQKGMENTLRYFTKQTTFVVPGIPRLTRNSNANLAERKQRFRWQLSSEETFAMLIQVVCHKRVQIKLHKTSNNAVKFTSLPIGTYANDFTNSAKKLQLDLSSAG